MAIRVPLHAGTLLCDPGMPQYGEGYGYDELLLFLSGAMAVFFFFFFFFFFFLRN